MNKVPLNDFGEVKRVSYKNFIGAVWVLTVMNRNCKKHEVVADYMIRLPIKWI